MATSNPFEKQIENRNFLSPTGFRFTLVKAPKVSFFSNTAQIPGISISPRTTNLSEGYPSAW